MLAEKASLCGTFSEVVLKTLEIVFSDHLNVRGSFLFAERK